MGNQFKALKFTSETAGREFWITVRRRVNKYFEENGISRKGDYRMWIKVVIMCLLYLVPFGVILSNRFSGNLPVFYGLWLLMALGVAGCGMCIMHDANHGALSKNRKVNRLFGGILNLIGGYALNWRIQHNVLHHNFPNIDGVDEDISLFGVFRFSPFQPQKAAFRYQHIYGWFLYGFSTFVWLTFKDFKLQFRYHRMGLLKLMGTSLSQELPLLFTQKILYYLVMLVLPIWILDAAWYHVLSAWFCMHFLAGLILGVVLQCAHKVSTVEFFLPDSESEMKTDWAVHQLLTTQNFTIRNRLLNWYVGGLNHQVEHHLFPGVCHIHYRNLSGIVKRTAREFDLPYFQQPSLRAALISHGKLLYQLGRA